MRALNLFYHNELNPEQERLSQVAYTGLYRDLDFTPPSIDNYNKLIDDQEDIEPSSDLRYLLTNLIESSKIYLIKNGWDLYSYDGSELSLEKNITNPGPSGSLQFIQSNTPDKLYFYWNYSSNSRGYAKIGSYDLLTKVFTSSTYYSDSSTVSFVTNGIIVYIPQINNYYRYTDQSLSNSSTTMWIEFSPTYSNWTRLNFSNWNSANDSSGKYTSYRLWLIVGNSQGVSLYFSRNSSSSSTIYSTCIYLRSSIDGTVFPSIPSNLTASSILNNYINKDSTSVTIDDTIFIFNKTQGCITSTDGLNYEKFDTSFILENHYLKTIKKIDEEYYAISSDSSGSEQQFYLSKDLIEWIPLSSPFILESPYYLDFTGTKEYLVLAYGKDTEQLYRLTGVNSSAIIESLDLFVPYHTHPDATTSESGFLNPTDKVKLNNLDEDLSLATNDKLGRIKLYQNLETIDDESVISNKGLANYIDQEVIQKMNAYY